MIVARWYVQLLPYGTGICDHAFIIYFYFLLFLSVPFVLFL